MGNQFGEFFSYVTKARSVYERAMNFLLCYLHLSYLVWQESTNCIPTKMRASCSSSGSSSDYGSRVPKFDSHWEVDFFLFSFIFLNQWCMLNQVHRGGTTDFSTLKEKNGGLAVQLEEKQAYYALNEKKNTVRAHLKRQVQLICNGNGIALCASCWGNFLSINGQVSRLKPLIEWLG